MLHTNNLRSEIRTAMDSVAAAAAHAASDPARPCYHYLPPAYWMNDPNGTIYHNGFYHLFYQHNPFADTWGDIHWGHARSRDLVHWQELPIALWPSRELGEAHCFSGCAAVDDHGVPRLYYTSVSGGDPEQRTPNEQWAATGDRDWLHWQKHTGNPILAPGKRGTPQFDREWRDPFIFSAANRQFMVVGATQDDVAGVALFESDDSQLLDWRYRGWLYKRPCEEVRFFECPNFFPLGGRWVLLTSPYTPIQYLVGDFDLETLTFEPDTAGTLDPGAAGDTPNFYASNIFWPPEGECILAGWVRGFPPGKGWNGCLALPRILTLNEDGRPGQQPVPQLNILRQTEIRKESFTASEDYRLSACRGNTFECQFTAEMQHDSSLDLFVGAQTSSILSLTDQTLTVAGTAVDLGALRGTPVDIHLYLDRSVVEVFAGDGTVAITRIIPVPDELGELQLSIAGSAARISDFAYWRLRL